MKKKAYTGTIEWEGTFEVCPLIELKEDGTLGKVSYVPYNFKFKNAVTKFKKEGC